MKYIRFKYEKIYYEEITKDKVEILEGKLWDLKSTGNSLNIN